MGYTVVTASSGEEALDRCLARGLEPDLLITDVVMPGITGSQLVAHLRSHRELACAVHIGFHRRCRRPSRRGQWRALPVEALHTCRSRA